MTGDSGRSEGAPGATPTEPTQVRRLGILVVYFLKDDDDLPILDLHLARVARHTAVPYTVYAAAPRLLDAGRSRLRAAPHVELCDLPATPMRGSREHGWYLDRLVARARGDDVSHLVTLDVDSFPISDAWVATAAGAAPADCGVSAIDRVENGDVALPHPSWTFAPRAFFDEPAPSFSPDSDRTPEFRRFLHSTGQRADTGIGLAYSLWRENRSWGRLRRTNAVDAHYLMAGVYADSVFHLGAAGRGNVFRRDLERSRVHRLTRPLERVPVRGARLVDAKRRALHAIRGRAEARIAAANRPVYEVLHDWLIADPDTLFAYLRGQASADETHGWASRLPDAPERP